MAFAGGVTRLGRQKAVIHELAAVETLARVNMVCFDKAGTLTTGHLALDRMEPIGTDSPATGAAAFTRAFNGSPDEMLEAIARATPDPGWAVTEVAPFSPQRKWSAASFEGTGAWMLGTPETILMT